MVQKIIALAKINWNSLHQTRIGDFHEHNRPRSLAGTHTPPKLAFSQRGSCKREVAKTRDRGPHWHHEHSRTRGLDTRKSCNGTLGRSKLYSQRRLGESAHSEILNTSWARTRLRKTIFLWKATVGPPHRLLFMQNGFFHEISPTGPELPISLQNGAF